MAKRTPDHIVFGGTFDPPHQGHFDCVNLARQTFPAAQISIIPSPVPAGAGGKHKHPSTPLVVRTQMVAMVMESLLSDKIRINDIEVSLPKPNFTLQTLKAMQTGKPHERLALLIGEDQLAHFAGWREPQQILRLADVLVARRHGQGYLGSDPWATLAESLGIKIERRPEGAYCHDLDSYFWVLDGNISEASSTEIRAAMRANKPIPDGWLPVRLARWMAQEKLYA